MANESDQDLVEKARGGDSQAFGQLVRRHHKSIFRLAVHMLRDKAEAEDVTQETFVRAWQSLARFEGNSQPYTWLYRIAVNLSLNVIRARKTRKPAAELDDPRVDAWLSAQGRVERANPADCSANRQLALALCDGIDSLSETLRTTLVLVCVEGLKLDAASEILGCPEGTVAWRVHEARRKLREHLNSRGFEDVEGAI
jgi:RNA polymerase sigma-70 factor (ECF subfamily)